VNEWDGKGKFDAVQGDITATRSVGGLICFTLDRTHTMGMTQWELRIAAKGAFGYVRERPLEESLAAG
jgi:hypothetical protein